MSAPSLLERLKADAPAPATTPIPLARGPSRCCAEFGTVTHCDGETMTVWCHLCRTESTMRCPQADLWPAPDAVAVTPAIKTVCGCRRGRNGTQEGDHDV